MPALAPADRRRIQKLSSLLSEVQQTRSTLSITRLRVVEKLCEAPKAAQQFASFLVRSALERFDTKPPEHLDVETRARHRRLMEEALEEMRNAADLAPTALTAVRAHTRRLRAEQSEHKDIPYGSVRLINDRWLLQVEEALSCFAGDHPGSPYWAYHTARTFAEEYDPFYGSGLIPRSAPALEEIVRFWLSFYDLPGPSLPLRSG